MKKKLILLGASLLSFGLIGGTLAAWAVTDKADPLNIGISPGTVDDDDDTQYVTLEWGTQKSVSNVSNLQRNEIRKAAVLDLKAKSDSQTNYTGSLEYALSHGNTSGQTLINDYLEINVYQGTVADTDGVVDPSALSEKTPIAFTNKAALVTVTNTKTTAESDSHNLYTVLVNLKSTMTLAQYDSVSDAQVTLTFDWNANAATELHGRTLYASGFTGGDVYVYAFGDDDARNAKWPGVKMDETNFSGYYEANIDTTLYHTVIFNNGNDQQSGDLAISTIFPASGEGRKNCFTYDGTTATTYGTTSYFDATKSPEYYIVGEGLTVGGKSVTWASEGVLAEAKMTAGATTATLNNVTAVEGARFKVYENVSGRYLIEGDDWLVTSEWAGVINITYTIGGTTGAAISVQKVS